MIKLALAQAVPGIPFLGEEGGGETDSAGYCWVLDPIDGTVNFARGSPLCTISLSLIVGGEPVLGIVYPLKPPRSAGCTGHIDDH